MASGASYILGGLLQGLGDGAQSAGKALRERKLEELKQKGQGKRDEADRQFRASESGKDRKFRATEGKADRDFRTGEGQMDRDARSKEGALDRRSAQDVARIRKGVGGGLGGMSVEEKRIWDSVVEAHTEFGADYQKKTDWKAVTRTLTENGHHKLAAQTGYRPDTGARPMNDDEAMKQATKDAEKRKSLWESRSTEFPETDGDEDAWIEKRAKALQKGEIWPPEKSQKKPAGNAGSVYAGEAKDDGGKSSRIQGNGSKDEPFRASNQGDIDWLIQNGTAGDVVQVPTGNGKWKTITLK